MSVTNPSFVACVHTRWPDSLYQLAVTAAASNYLTIPSLKLELLRLPNYVLFDVYFKLYRLERLCQLGVEFSNLSLFMRMLSVCDRRPDLSLCFQGLVDHGLALYELLCTAYVAQCDCLYTALSKRKSTSEVEDIKHHISMGTMLGVFLYECGWYPDAIRCFESCVRLTSLCETATSLKWRFDCYVWLLELHNANCQFTLGERVIECANETRARLQELNFSLNLAVFYCALSLYNFNVSKYSEAALWSLQALRDIKPTTPHKVIVHVFRHAAKVFCQQRKFSLGSLLINHAMSLTNYYFEGGRRLTDTWMDFGLCLMNLDLADAACKAYQTAIDLRQGVFGGNNLKLAQAHEDLAYALYVKEYSTGEFLQAQEHANRSMEILKKVIADPQHLILASSRRVKALILEEIAIDSDDKMLEDRLLHEAEELHFSAFTLCRRVFGDRNLQTAKHYGNLGRLYQSMERFDEAERMHLKAIEIKEELLGDADFEVALSVGHLAALYNYDMERYEDAEKLYLRSIRIGTQLFGDAYSGLEYDYRGLIRVYAALDTEERLMHYVGKLQQWKTLRDHLLAENTAEAILAKIDEYPRDTQDVLVEFFKKYL